MKSKWSGDLWGMSKSHAEPYATIPYLNRLPCDLCGGLYSFLTDIYHSVEKIATNVAFLKNFASEASKIYLNFRAKITSFLLLIFFFNFRAKNHFWVAL